MSVRSLALPLALTSALAALAGCASVSGDAPAAAAPSPAARPAPAATTSTPAFAAQADARAQLEQVLAKAKAQNRLALIVWGADWCHDSIALARALDDPVVRPLVDAHYEVLFLDAGTPQSGQGRNLDLAAGLGVSDITGTPTAVVVGRDGRTLNADTARGWRNAASRSTAAIAAVLAGFAGVSP